MRKSPGIVCCNGLVSIDFFRHTNNEEPQIFILSHLHFDHTVGLKNSWDLGTIYCSEITKAFIQIHFKIDNDRIVSIPYNVDYQIDLNDGFLIIRLIDAHHCPGSAMIILTRYSATTNDSIVSLYTGDFRFEHSNKIDLKKLSNYRFDAVFIDDTYLYCSSDASKIHTFPDRLNACQQAIEWIEAIHYESSSSIIYIPIYSIGRENVLVEIAQHFNIQISIHCEMRYEVMKALSIDQYFTLDQNSWIRTCARSSKYNNINGKVLLLTGLSAANGTICYSDHCSQQELLDFIMNISTVKLFSLSGIEIRQSFIDHMCSNKDNQSEDVISVDSLNLDQPSTKEIERNPIELYVSEYGMFNVSTADRLFALLNKVLSD